MAGSNSFLEGALRVLREVATRALDRSTRTERPRASNRRSSSSTEHPTPKSSRQSKGAASRGGGSTYPGDFRGRPEISYHPLDDQRPDPGEIVWTWVPYEEDHTEGKDRPVLLIGRDSPWLLGLQVTSQDHDRDKAQEARSGRYWVDIGTGAWDAKRRPSEARVNRILRIDPDTVRRIGAVLDEDIFRDVAREVLRHT